jgi:general secretion pathway protein M
MSWARIEPLRSAWRGLAPRERALIGSGITLVAAVAVYVLGIGPFNRSLEKLRVEVPQQRAQLAVMREQAALVARLRRDAPGRTPPAKLSAQAEQAADAHGLRSAIVRIEPEGSTGVRVALEAAPFNAVVAWLAELQQRSGLRAETATIESHATSGAVTARFVLRAPGS